MKNIKKILLTAAMVMHLSMPMRGLGFRLMLIAWGIQ